MSLNLIWPSMGLDNIVYLKGFFMKNSSIIRLCIVIFLLSAWVWSNAFAVSYAPEFYHGHEKNESFTVGSEVYLFYSGTDEIRRIIHTGDRLTVYRIDSSCEIREAGKIKVLSYIGETYIKAVVLEGEIKADDIAKKGKVSALVISAVMCNK